MLHHSQGIHFIQFHLELPWAESYNYGQESDLATKRVHILIHSKEYIL